MSVQVQPVVLQETGRTQRRLRSPKHTFRLSVRPFHIQPCMIAPVLPGETLSNLLLQSRIVTDPLVGRLTGWWAEYYFFYVKHRDLDIADDLVEMHLDPTFDPTSLKSAASAVHYHNGGINFTAKCLDIVTEYYFRDADEAGVSLDGLPLATLNGNGWWDSLKLEDATVNVSQDELPGENPHVPDTVPAGFENHFQQWEAMRAMNITTASFEDYLASFGVRTPEVQEHEKRPELLRYVRDWSYPSNTINPADGSASSAVSWSMAERADKDRLFKEPGFIFGCQVIRPKVMLKNAVGSLSHYMDGAFNWLPAIMQDHAFTSLKEFTEDAGPIDSSVAIGDDYWIDLRDLFLHGEQFFNSAAAVENGVTLPSTTLDVRYATSTDIDAMFAGTAKRIHSDGVVSLSIKSTVNKDHT